MLMQSYTAFPLTLLQHSQVFLNSFSHPGELNINDAPHFTVLATRRGIHKLSIQFYGSLMLLKFLKVLRATRGARTTDSKLTPLTSLEQSHKTYLSLTLSGSQQTPQGRVSDLVMHASPPPSAISDTPEDRQHLD
ncbi:hypothetical protein B0H14DRAFT_2599682 [Mycena olivaceomarginata]|nr:hypothetical protein B0H14DRAFT_2599682 [Mycena olivaceomarginata]